MSNLNPATGTTDSVYQPQPGDNPADTVHGRSQTADTIIVDLEAVEVDLVSLYQQAGRFVVEAAGAYGPRPAGVTSRVLYIGLDDPTSSPAANATAPALVIDLWISLGGSGTVYTGSAPVVVTGSTISMAANAYDPYGVSAAETTRAEAAETAAQTRANDSAYRIVYDTTTAAWPARPAVTSVPAGYASYTAAVSSAAQPTDTQPGDTVVIA